MECYFCKMTHTVAVPSVHLNGTKADDLYEQLDIAIASLQVARKRLLNAAPNGRDYSPQAPHAINRAISEAEVRYQSLEKIIKELEEVQRHVATAMAVRRAK